MPLAGRNLGCIALTSHEMEQCEPNEGGFLAVALAQNSNMPVLLEANSESSSFVACVDFCILKEGGLLFPTILPDANVAVHRNLLQTANAAPQLGQGAAFAAVYGVLKGHSSSHKQNRSPHAQKESNVDKL